MVHLNLENDLWKNWKADRIPVSDLEIYLLKTKVCSKAGSLEMDDSSKQGLLENGVAVFT